MKPDYKRLEDLINKKLYEINEELDDRNILALERLLDKVKNYSDTNCSWLLKAAQPFLERILNDAILEKKRIKSHKTK